MLNSAPRCAFVAPPAHRGIRGMRDLRLLNFRGRLNRQRRYCTHGCTDASQTAGNSVSDEPDRMTLERARCRDRAAQAALLRLLQDRLWRICRALLADKALAEDAVQETALRLLVGLPGFDGRSRTTTWATGIALNVCRELARRESRARQPPPPHAFSASDRPADPAELTRMHAALAALPPRQREAVVLRYLEGLDVNETAELMGCAPGTVKATVHAGLAKLRAMLVEEPG